MSRYWRMKDFDVLHPMGWDAFGLPAEQYAIQTGTPPASTTKGNIATFKRQLKSLGFSYDWSRELSTTDEGYFKWTQWIFLELFKSGLAEQSNVLVNWCPALGTVLANEEIIDGLSERGGHPVERLPLRQWVLKITACADELEEGLPGLSWPEGTMAAQKSWIGRSEGAEVVFGLEGGGGALGSDELRVFTTRPDTVMGVTYVVVAPEHPLVEALTSPENKAAVEDYRRATSGKSDMDRTLAAASKTKTGVPTGAFAVHPLSGERVPVWVADYVLGSYGTGAVMAVPAHDERDLAFAHAFGLPVKFVVAPPGGVAAPGEEAEAFTAPGVAVNSGQFDGLPTAEAKTAVTKALAAAGKGGEQITYKLRDWVFSRQRYWGEPIPIFFPVDLAAPGSDPRTHPHTIRFDDPRPVPFEELPLRLPEMDDYAPGDDPQGCLARATDWRYFQRDGQWFARETNTMPQWAGSCWYYLRFTDPTNSDEAWSAKAEADWMPVDLYVGGAEHAVLHLLYARFWHKVLFRLGKVSSSEPFQRLVHQGMILGSDGEKMSKSRGNVVNPDDVVLEHGADALRLYEMFMGPLEAVKPWQTSQMSGVVRFRNRVHALCLRPLSEEPMDEATARAVHKTMKKVTGDVESLAFNTAISALMVLTNQLSALDTTPKEGVEKLVLMLSPIAPHLCEECWQLLGHSGSLAREPWVTWDESLCVETTVQIGVQVNGKARASLELNKDTPEDAASAAALEIPKVAHLVEGKTVKKVIYVPGRIINIIVG